MAVGGRKREETTKQEGGVEEPFGPFYKKTASVRPAPLEEGWEPYGGGGAAERNLRRANLKHSP